MVEDGGVEMLVQLMLSSEADDGDYQRQEKRPAVPLAKQVFLVC